MAENFRMVFHQNDENLHLKLFGDFDGDSAFKLLRVLKKNAFCMSRIFIHTASVNSISPSAADTFKKNLSVLNGKSISFVFTGKDADQLVPAKEKSFRAVSG